MRQICSLYCLLVVCVLMGCSGDGVQMRQQLEELEQQNRSGVSMLNDSLAESLVDYFDRHGSANEQMRAKYILGRTYYCLGELPRALETYYEAADCADTTAADCDYKILSRIHAQSAIIYYDQVQPYSQLTELRQAVYYAKNGRDTLISIECYAQQANAYILMHKYDSAIYVKECASRMYNEIGRKDYSCLTLLTIIRPLIIRNEIDKAGYYLHLYETSSRVFDDTGEVEKGREIYYYIKGEYFLAIHQLDSAENMFRKELHLGKDLNNQIAGFTGMQKVYEQKKNSDSIAKYASLCNVYNDSAYSLSEMQNIQKFQASYNYNHQKYLAEKRRLGLQVTWLITVLVVIIFSIIGYFFIQKYKVFRDAALDYRLRNADIAKHFRNLANHNPPKYPSNEDWKQLREFVEHEVPSFPLILRTEGHPLNDMEYDVCLMIRVHMKPLEIAKLKKCAPSYISNIRKNLLTRVFGMEGNSEVFDDEIRNIGYNKWL